MYFDMMIFNSAASFFKSSVIFFSHFRRKAWASSHVIPGPAWTSSFSPKIRDHHIKIQIKPMACLMTERFAFYDVFWGYSEVLKLTLKVLPRNLAFVSQQIWMRSFKWGTIPPCRLQKISFERSDSYLFGARRSRS